MAKKVSEIFTSKSAHSTATYAYQMQHKSDGQLMEGKGPKPKTPADHRLHLSHIVDSSYYNLRHSFDHTDELAFDFKRLSKDIPKDAESLRAQTIRILNPNFSKMGLKLKEK